MGICRKKSSRSDQLLSSNLLKPFPHCKCQSLNSRLNTSGQAAGRHQRRSQGHSMWRQIWAVGLEPSSDQFFSVHEPSLLTLCFGLHGRDGRRPCWLRAKGRTRLRATSSSFLGSWTYRQIVPGGLYTWRCESGMLWLLDWWSGFCIVGLPASFNYQCGLGLCNDQMIFSGKVSFCVHF